ncbi:MAG TPA: hypothetical protein VLM39_01275, partial [Ignavibacteriaceae bacterium]|nr:hypothetical protein [Ignavibacteriaceae bacterium]
KYNENRESRKSSALEEIFEKTNNKNYNYVQSCPGKNYSQIINSDLNTYFFENRTSNRIDEAKKELLSLLNKSTSYLPKLKIQAPIDIIASYSVSEENIYIYLTNVKGLCESCNSNDKSIKKIKIFYNESLGNEDVSILPFLGKETKLEVTRDEQEFSFIIPEINRGMVVIINK